MKIYEWIFEWIGWMNIYEWIGWMKEWMPEEKAYGITVTIMNIVRSKMSTVGIIARIS